MLKRRGLAIDAASTERWITALPAIRQLEGVRSAALAGDMLTIEYDPRRTGLARIEAWAEAHGLRLRSGALRRLQRALWKFTERNEQENAAHPAGGACCNRPPPGSA
ncbi:MAG TPA: hypothetical protein VF816_09505 [Rhodocyclaceae bacterium]